MNLLRRFIDWFFNFEDLSIYDDGEYILRWRLASFRGRRVYLHKIMGTDWAREPHDHPKGFVSIGLKGRYVEEVYEIHCDSLYLRELITFEAPWIRYFPGEHIHRLQVRKGEHAWTICLTRKPYREWGFYSEDGTKTPYLEFFKRKLG